MNHEQAGDMRAMIMRGTVEAVYDDGPMQLVDVRTADGFLRTGIEVAQLYGMGHSPPPGGLVLVLAVGGDPGDLMAWPTMHPGARYGNLASGEMGIYRWPDGTRVMLRGGGVIEILAASKVIMSAGHLVITAPEGVSITGDVTVTGNLRTTGNLAAGTGVSGSFTAQGGNVVSVAEGVVKNIV